MRSAGRTRGWRCGAASKFASRPEAADGKLNGWRLGPDISDGYWLNFVPAFAASSYVIDAPFEALETKKKTFHASAFADIVDEKTSLMIVRRGNQYFKKTENGIGNLLLREWEAHFTARCDWPTDSLSIR